MSDPAIKYHHLFNELDKPFNSMAKVEWLLLKYEEEYKRLIKKGIGLIQLTETKDFDVFIRIYEELSKLSDYHRFEPYFKQQVEEYEQRSHIKHSLQQEWARKNEDIAVIEFMLFEFEYFDENGGQKHLKLRHLFDDTLEILVDRCDFKYTLLFLEIFDELFWEQEILPDRVRSLELDHKIKNTLCPRAWNIDNE